ncbi:MAG: hypothetical protein RLY86_447 [Pseudomonadota bacterium]|jgi:two-component system CAI-1 autoinducer sensor kinase/phosphatase CqsS
MSGAVGAWRGFRRHLARDFDARFPHTRLRLQGLTLLGVVSFPAFHGIWALLIVQPYENLGLRLIGTAFCLLMYLNAVWRPILGRLVGVVSYVALVYCIPFFFTFMMLKNGVNAVWLGTEVCGILFLSLLMGPWNLLVCFLLGAGLAVAAFLLTGGVMPWEALVAAAPVLTFAFIGGIGLNYNEVLNTRQNRFRAAAALGGSIAHEMRTPLLGIRMEVETLRDCLEAAEQDRAAARDSAGDRTQADRTQAEGLGVGAPETLDMIGRALDRIDLNTRYANMTLDTILTNVVSPYTAKGAFKRLSMSTVVAGALARYPFRGREREHVTLAVQSDFTFTGSDILMTHVIYNLLKNSLKAIAGRSGAGITVTVEGGFTGGRVTVADTGCGMPPEMVRLAFQPFASQSDGDTGVGLGLAFVKRVVEDMGGSVSLSSRLGEGSRVVIILP